MGFAYFLCVMLLLFLSWPLLKRLVPEITDWLFSLEVEYQQTQGNVRAWRFFLKKVQPYLSLNLIAKMDRLLRLAGRPWKINAIELLLLQISIPAVFFVWSIFQPDAATAILLFGGWAAFTPLQLLRSRKKKRQLEAAASIRWLKQRFVMLLDIKMPVNLALRDIAGILQNDFGDTFRSYINQIGKRPAHEVMAELRQEYEVKELDNFCIAIELNDENEALDRLASMIEAQILDEDERIDEFLRNQVEAAKPKMITMVAIGSFWNLIFLIIFGVMVFKDTFQGGGGFLQF